MLIKPEQTVDTNLITALLQTSKGCMSNMAQSFSILLTCTVALLQPRIPPSSLGFSFYRHSASLSLEQSNVSISALEILVPLATMIVPRQSHTWLYSSFRGSFKCHFFKADIMNPLSKTVSTPYHTYTSYGISLPCFLSLFSIYN